MFVPVVDSNNVPLMPTKPSRARRWIKERKATPFFKRGVFCVRLNIKPSAREHQDIACGIDPGSKREAFTVKSAAHTYLNIQTSTPDWIKDALNTRKVMRLSRRKKWTPCRKPRFNRARGIAKGNMPPSTKARWQWKTRIANWLAKMFPITRFVVEDIKAHTFGGRKWNISFSPLQTGKKWLYTELSKIAQVNLKQGWETKELRDSAGLKKTTKKLSEVFSAHCVDSWVLANSWTGGHTQPDNESLLIISPLRFHRRQLHAICPSAGAVRRPYGGTISVGLKRGSLIKHQKHGVTYVGGAMAGRISLHSIHSGKRLCQNAKLQDCKFLTFNSWRWKSTLEYVLPPKSKDLGFCA